MQAVIFEQSGKAQDVLKIHDIAPPIAGQDQVLIRVSSRPIHPADFLFIEGRYRIKPIFPQVAGFDGVGMITACGPGITNYHPGMRVAFRSPGAWAELAVAPVSRVYPVPAEISDAIACQFPLNPLTAWGLLEECKLAEGNRLLITAGRSVIARILTKLSQRKRLKATLLVQEGMGYVAIDTETGQTVSKGISVKETLQGAIAEGRFHAVLDAVGGSATLAIMKALEHRGRLISYGLLDDSPITLYASTLLFKNIIWQGFGIDGWLDNATQGQLATAQEELWGMLSEDPNLLPVIQCFSLSEVKEAIRVVYEMRQPGKVLLVS
jgi:NADPH:quinone reductase